MKIKEACGLLRYCFIKMTNNNMETMWNILMWWWWVIVIWLGKFVYSHVANIATHVLVIWGAFVCLFPHLTWLGDIHETLFECCTTLQYLQLSVMNNTNMAVTWTCEVEARLVPFSVWPLEVLYAYGNRSLKSI